MRHALPLFVVALALLAFAAPAAQADTITYAFEGTWGFPDPSPTLGKSFSGTFTYDTDWGDLDPSSGTGESYWRHASGTSMSWTITFDGSTYSRAAGQAAIELADVVDNDPTTSSEPDYFSLFSANSSGEGFEIWLQDNSATWLPGVAVPSIPTVLDLSDFSGYDDLYLGGPSTYIAFRDKAGNWIDGEITGLNPVPEPATLALLGAGLAGLGLHRRRRRRS